MKKFLVVLGVVAILLLVFVLYYIGSGSAQKNAEDKLREDNPLFHTVSEGGSCRPGEGDCVGGLTCSEEGTCVKP